MAPFPPFTNDRGELDAIGMFLIGLLVGSTIGILAFAVALS